MEASSRQISGTGQSTYGSAKEVCQIPVFSNTKQYLLQHTGLSCGCTSDLVCIHLGEVVLLLVA
jgi:hypothetical protein